MRCKTALTRIDALRTGELETNEQQLVKQHLDRCPSCHQSVGDVESFAATVKALVAKPSRSCLDRLQKQLSDCYDVISSGRDRIWVAFSNRGIRMLDLAAGSSAEFEQKYLAKFGRSLRHASLPARYREQVLSALQGKGPKRPAVDLSGVSPFERNVLRTLLRIPRGQVRSYQWVARQIHRPTAARAIGNVMAHNPVPLLLPCHRVVPASGGLGNYAFGGARKRALLLGEGCPVHELEGRRRDGARA